MSIRKNSSENPFQRMCTCGYTDWCSDTTDGCARSNPKLWDTTTTTTTNATRPVVPLSELAAPLLQKFGRSS